MANTLKLEQIDGATGEPRPECTITGIYPEDVDRFRKDMRASFRKVAAWNSDWTRVTSSNL